MPPPEPPEPENEATDPEEDDEDENGAPPEPAELPPLRPRRGRPPAGEVRSPATAFFERRNATPNFRETSQYWIYRLEPITDLVATGRDKYVGIFQEPCDEDRIMKHPDCGSGVYMLMFKTRNEQGQMVLTEKLDRLDIENQHYPPCIPPGAWLEDRRNARWAWAKTIYDARAKEAEKKNAPPTPAQGLTVQDITATVENAIEKKLSQQAGPKDDTILNAVRTGLDLASAQNKPQGDSQVLGFLRDEMSDLRKRNESLENRLLDMLAKAASPPPAATAAATQDGHRNVAGNGRPDRRA